MINNLLSQSTVKPGNVYGSRTILGLPFKHIIKDCGKIRSRAACVCRCECGKIDVVYVSSLHRGTNCRCKQASGSLAATFKHGKAKTKLYGVWSGIKSRCKSNAYYKGIEMCQEWATSFKDFYTWSMANGYVEGTGLVIDRIDGTGNYTPSNCRWTTVSENQRNKPSNPSRTAFGESKTIAAWVEDKRCRVSERTLRSRVARGWQFEKALQQPIGR